MANDIALLFFSNEITFNNYIQPAVLPSQKSNTYPGTNITAYVAGWGTTTAGGFTSDNLMNVKITIYDASFCDKVGQLSNGQICAGW